MNKRSAIWVLLAFFAMAAFAGCSGETVKSEETPGAGGAPKGAKPAVTETAKPATTIEQPSSSNIGAGAGSGAGASDAGAATGGAGSGASAAAAAGTPTEGAVVKPAAGGAAGAGESHPELKTVYFDYDKSDIRPGDAETLKGNLKFLKSNKSRVLIEGNCDERGTNEYNLALGERRSNAVRRYLTDLGVEGGRMEIISYGEERPAVRESNEAAWAKNRRAEFKILK